MNSLLLKKRKKYFKLIAANAFFIILCAVILLPIAYVVSVSFSGKGAGLSGGNILIPKNFTLENYKAVLFEKPFLQWLKNSLVLGGGTVLLSLSCGIPAAYAFSRWRFRFRKSLLMTLIVLNAFPQILSLFAIFRILKMGGMLNSHVGLTIIYAGTMCIFSIWNMKGYFDTIPVEIEEASKIDGAGDMQMIFNIVIPLAKPSIIVTSVISLITVWNEYIFATTFLLDSKYYSLAGGLYQLQKDNYYTNWPLFTAAAVMASLPLLIIFFRIQKYLVSGLTAGGVKG